MNIEFCEINYDHCGLCYELKRDFKEKNKCTWKDVFESEKFPQLSCSEHSIQKEINEPLIFMITKENRAKRGEFTYSSISNICKNETCEKKIYYNYFDCITDQNKFVPSKLVPKFCQELKKKLETDLNNVTKQFFHLIIDETWSNSTIVINDEDSMQMVTLLKLWGKVNCLKNDCSKTKFSVKSKNKLGHFEKKKLQLFYI